MASTSLKQALVAAGANLGDRVATLANAMARLREMDGVESLDSSPIYETAPVGMLDQPPFLNLVMGIETTLGPEALLARLQEIEREFGRVREIRWGPRTLDLDLLAYEGETRATPSLQLPHPRMLERGFVMIPLRDLLMKPLFQREPWRALLAQATAFGIRHDVRRWS
jgi:2-amino-4-hydroxy-6-hydroxymethyldihydropteridine diphosphokinase